jgi:hypothetical protein
MSTCMHCCLRLRLIDPKIIITMSDILRKSFIDSDRAV